MLLASLRVIVTVEVAVPSATTGDVPVIVEFAATAEPAVNVTVPPAFTTGVAIESVFTSATVEERVHVETPEAFDAEQTPYEFVEDVSVAEKVGVTPGTKLLEASFNVIVTVEVAEPFATTGDVPEIVELAATGAPAVKVTVPPAFTTGVAIERVLISAIVDEIVQVETPDAFETLQAP